MAEKEGFDLVLDAAAGIVVYSKPEIGPDRQGTAEPRAGNRQAGPASPDGRRRQ